MIYENILYHNVDEIEKTAQGYKIYRYPKKIINNLNEAAKVIARYSCGCEMRFVTDSNRVWITLLGKQGGENGGDIFVFKGDYFYSSYKIHEGKITTIELNEPEHFHNVDDEFFDNNIFAPCVWRVYFSNTMIEVLDVDAFGGNIRPPKSEEMPAHTILSYGSSISHGSNTVANTSTYVNTFARLLRYDALRKGLGGSCHAESLIADHFAENVKWDCALMEIGINMLRVYDSNEFKKRFEYFAQRIYDTGKKAVFLTIPRYFGYYENDELKEKVKSFNDIIACKVSEFKSERALLISGEQIVKSTSYLSADCLHPSTEGHVDMGYNLYDAVKNWINE